MRHGLAESITALTHGPSTTLPPRDIVQTWCLESVLWRALGDRDRAAELVHRAVDAARDLDETVVAACRRALVLCGEQVDCDSPLATLMATLHEARHALDQERFALAAATADTAMRLCRTGGHPGYEPYALSVRAEARAGSGQLNDALLDAMLAVRLRESAGVTGDRAFGLLVLGRVHRRRRDEAAARAVLDAAAESLACEAERATVEPVVLAELGRVCASARPDLAREYVDRAVAITGPHQRHTALVARGWVLLAAGDTAAAVAAATAARDAAPARPATTAETDELRSLAAIDETTATQRIRAAAAAYRQVPDDVGETRALIVGAALRHGPGYRLTAEEHDSLRRHGVDTERGVADALTVIMSRAPLVAVHALGKFQVLRSGDEVRPHEWQSKKARDLLKILVCWRGRPVPRSRLIELLWPGQPSAVGSSRLSVQLSVLRRVLAPNHRTMSVDPLVADRATVAVNTDVVWIDVERFLAVAHEGLLAHRRGDGNALDRLAVAEELYTGEFMPDGPYATWTYELRDDVESAYVNVLRAQAAAASDVDHRMSCLRRILLRDPYDEHAHVQLIAVLHQAGRRGEARRRYTAYVDSMREIGVTPAELSRIH